MLDPALSGLRPLSFDDVFEYISEGLVVADFDGDLVHWNRAALTMHGMASLAEACRPLADFLAVYRMESLDGRLLPFDEWPMPRIMRGELVADLEIRISRLDQPWSRIFRYGGSLVREASGKPRFAVLHISDISAQKDAEFRLTEELRRQEFIQASLRESEAKLRGLYEELEARDARLRVLLDQLPISVWSTDRDLRINFAAGRTLRQLAGAASIIGLDVGAAAGAENPDSLENHQQALAGETIQRVTPRQGLIQRITLAPLRSSEGAIIGVLGLSNDITELAHSQQALQEAEEISRLAQRIGHSGNWEVRVDEQAKPIGTTFWSEGQYRLWGIPQGEPMPVGYTRPMIHPEDLPTFDAFTRDLLSGEEKDHSALFRITRTDGELRFLRVYARPFFEGPARRFSRLIGMTLDVTDEQLAKREVQRLNADLEATVLVRTAELRTINQELESFAYAVSHDLRAPLRAMSGFSRALLEDYGGVLDGEARQFLQHIISASKTMGELIDGLLTLSRYVRGEFHREQVDLSALATQIVSELARTEPDRAVSVSIEPGLEAEGDPRLLAAALRNLLANAWKYSCRVPAAAIRVYATDKEGVRWFCVTDNGAGFSMAHASKLFVPFQRLHRQDEFPGIGIGLATVQRVINRHGGVIEAEGALAQGATFRFTLPPTTKTDKTTP